ncbi:MAG: hypothetical protein M1814_003129 [Vezdaea aestivalis]|nr:MAG: hypothetical protein M1814_003129 [Vezdaea aestivalis]
MAERRVGNCTHGTMTILHGQFRCSACNRASNLGWVYRCTEDEVGLLAEALTNEQKIIHFDRLMKGYTNPSTEPPYLPKDGMLRFDRATNSNVLTSQYTDEQREIIHIQKENVKGTLKRQRARSSPGKVLKGATFDAIIAQSSAVIKPSRTSVLSPARSIVKPVQVNCDWKLCHACRHTTIERAWCHIDTVLALPTATVLELAGTRPNLRVSDVRHVRNLGLRSNPRASASAADIASAHAYYDMDYENMYDSGSSSASSGTLPRSRTFRHSMSEIFKNMMGRRSVPQLSGYRKESQQKPMEEVDIADWNGVEVGSREAKLQLTAAATPLPGTDDEDEVDEFGSGPVAVTGGLAVREQAVTDGAADLVVQD